VKTRRAKQRRAPVERLRGQPGDDTSFTKWIQADVALLPAVLWDEEEKAPKRRRFWVHDVKNIKRRKAYDEYHHLCHKARLLLDPIGCLGPLA